jgi:anti-sigma factor RsiW
MSCDPEQVTGYVDGELAPAARAELEAHLAQCASCREQADYEGQLRARLKALPSPEPRRGLEMEIRGSLKRPRPSRFRVLLPMAAAFAAMLLWSAGLPRVVAWQLSRDHDHCFSAKVLPAEVWGGNAHVIASWLEKRGTELPPLPESAAGLDLVGARRCPLLDRKVAHLYYSSGERHVSLFVVPGSVRFESRYSSLARGNVVRLLHVAGTTVGVVGASEEDVAAFERAFATTSAKRREASADPQV